MDRLRIPVDFNELVAADLVLLSKEDVKQDSGGNDVCQSVGLRVYVYEMDCDDAGRPVALVADGVAEMNDPDVNGDWSKAAKWCCRTGEKGIYHLPIEESEVKYAFKQQPGSRSGSCGQPKDDFAVQESRKSNDVPEIDSLIIGMSIAPMGRLTVWAWRVTCAMPLQTIAGHFDGTHVLFDEDVQLPKNARLIITVLEDRDQDRADLYALSASGLNAAYVDGEEVEYSEEDFAP